MSSRLGASEGTLLCRAGSAPPWQAAWVGLTLIAGLALPARSWGASEIEPHVDAPASLASLRLTNRLLGLDGAAAPSLFPDGTSSAVTPAGEPSPWKAALLGTVIGFGGGQLEVGDTFRSGLWIFVDVALLTTAVLLTNTVGGTAALVAWVVFGADRVLQGTDAYRAARHRSRLTAEETPDLEIRLSPIRQASMADPTPRPLWSWAFGN